ncbi:MAG: hydroxysqualene dehydroxylase HpnE [Verrucomicrobiota bacterium]
MTKKSGSNFIFSFLSLPKERRVAMSVFYAFCRLADDIVDEKPLDSAKAQAAIDEWRQEIAACYAGAPTTDFGKELAEIIQRYDIPRVPFDEILNGVEMDLQDKRYATFEDLKIYCQRVASAVGLVSIRIFGCIDPQSEEYAVNLGLAFQLTNILRDVRHDLEEYNRVYLPQDEMVAFGVTEDNLRAHSAKCEKLFRLQYFRAKHYYNRARRLISPQDAKKLKPAFLMTSIYEGILEKIRKKNFRVFDKKIRLNKLEKFCALLGDLGVRLTHSRNRECVSLTPKSIAVFGGGFAGITAAIHAALQGHRVEVFENKPFIGGRAHSYRESKTGQTIDNSQHVIMGCYRTSHELFRILGVTDKFFVQDPLLLHFISPSKGVTELKASKLPAPLHLLTALLGYKELTWLDRFSILCFGIVLRLGCKPKQGWTVEKWLLSSLQTRNAIRSLWEPLAIAALNEPIRDADARLFYEVARRSLFGRRNDSALYTSKVGWSDLVMPEAQHYLRATGGELHLSTAVKEIQFAGNKVISFTTSKGETLQKDLYISALPWYTFASLLPEGHALREQIQKIQSAPLVGLYLWTNQPLIPKPAVAFLDSPVQWIFEHPLEKEGEYLYAIVISAAYAHLDQKPKEILEFVLNEIHRVWPDSQKAQIRHSIVYKARDATLAARPETALLRPAPLTPWKNLLLAGDWTDTKLPSTLESAVWSGWNVAQKI